MAKKKRKHEYIYTRGNFLVNVSHMLGPLQPSSTAPST